VKGLEYPDDDDEAYESGLNPERYFWWLYRERSGNSSLVAD
jgi:hypothetical protein